MKNNTNFEYTEPIELADGQKGYFVIPESFIMTREVNNKRISIYSYFAAHNSMENTIFFSVSGILKWLNRTPDRSKTGINTKIKEVIEYMKQYNYLLPIADDKYWSYMHFNLSKIKEQCNTEKFAVIYLDEIEAIMNYSSEKKYDNYFNTDVIMLVFAYIRMRIYRRKNQLRPEENVTNISDRKVKFPEVYDCFYKDIGEDLHLSARVVSKAINVLNKIGLIYTEELPRVKYKDGSWHTSHTLFCNMYKREGNYLLASGAEYYLSEITAKKIKLKKEGICHESS